MPVTPRKSQSSQEDKKKKEAPKKAAAPAGADLRGWVGCVVTADGA